MPPSRKTPLVFYLLLAWFAYSVLLTAALLVWMVWAVSSIEMDSIGLTDFVNVFLSTSVWTIPGVLVFGGYLTILRKWLLRQSPAVRALLNWIALVLGMALSLVIVELLRHKSVAGSTVQLVLAMMLVAGLFMLVLPGIRRRLLFMELTQ